MKQKNYGTRMHSSRMPTVRSRRVSAQGGCLPRVCGVSQHALGQTPPVNRMTDRCKNITFPQLCLRTVKIKQVPKLLNCPLDPHLKFCLHQNVNRYFFLDIFPGGITKLMKLRKCSLQSLKFFANCMFINSKNVKQVIGDSKSYLSGLPWLCINVSAYFGWFLALSWIKCRKVTMHKCPCMNVLCVAMHRCWNGT